METTELDKLKGFHFLVVDDNQINRLIASRTLMKFGATVEVAENGEVALDMMNKDLYDLLLMDIQMPVMDGYEAVRRVRSRSENYFRKLPIIALTAIPDPDEIEDCGMDDFLAKPWGADELLNKITRILK